jgi:hypothetical protein
MPAFPATLYPDSVKVARRRVQARAESPFSLTNQIFDWNASRYEISIIMPQLSQADAATYGAWLESLNGMVGTFTFNLDPWIAGTTPGTRTFRLVSPVTNYDADRAYIWRGFQLDAIEVV